MKSCTPLWREPHLEVQSTPTPDHFWKLRCRKSARHCGAKHVWKSECAKTKHLSVRARLEGEMSKNCTPLWREAHFQVKMYKTHYARKLRCRKSARHCGAKHVSKSKVEKTEGYGPDVVSRGRHKGFCTLPKVSKTCVAFSKALAGAGRSKRIRKDAFSVAGAVRETCSSEMFGGQGGDILRRVAF